MSAYTQKINNKQYTNIQKKINQSVCLPIAHCRLRNNWDLLVDILVCSKYDWIIVTRFLDTGNKQRSGCDCERSGCACRWVQFIATVIMIHTDNRWKYKTMNTPWATKRNATLISTATLPIFEHRVPMERYMCSLQFTLYNLGKISQNCTNFTSVQEIEKSFPLNRRVFAVHEFKFALPILKRPNKRVAMTTKRRQKLVKVAQISVPYKIWGQFLRDSCVTSHVTTYCDIGCSQPSQIVAQRSYFSMFGNYQSIFWQKLFAFQLAVDQKFYPRTSV